MQHIFLVEEKKGKGVFLFMWKGKAGLLSFGFGWVCFLLVFFSQWNGRSATEEIWQHSATLKTHLQVLAFRKLLLYYQKSIAIGTDHGKCRYALLLEIIQQEPGSQFFSLSDDWPNCWSIGYYSGMLESISEQDFVENILIKIDFHFPQILLVCTY